MTAIPRQWPTVAADARDRAAEAAQAGMRALEPVVTGERQFTETEKLRREAIALNSLQLVVRLMESQGAPTRP
jgi:hypothetical protein